MTNFAHAPVRRVAMLSMHTSPLAQPGSGDAGGLNVYVDQTARRLARRGIAVQVFTRATASDQPPVVQVEPGYQVRHVLAGPFDGLPRRDLPAQLCPFAAGVLRAAAPAGRGAPFDVVHSHYWLAGQVGYLVRDRWGIPLVHSAHTLAKVKNAALAGSADRPEPDARVIGEEQVVAEADLLLAATDVEATQLTDLYGADRARVAVVHPGVDVEVFSPIPSPAGVRPGPPSVLARWDRASTQQAAERVLAPWDRASTQRAGERAQAGPAVGRAGAADRAALGIGDGEIVLAFAGRIQPHKGPAVLVRGHDAGDWADAMAAVALDPARRARMALAARAHAERFSWEATVDALMAAYRRAARPGALRLGAGA